MNVPSLILRATYSAHRTLRRLILLITDKEHELRISRREHLRINQNKFILHKVYQILA
jgi:hypothetical protein